MTEKARLPNDDRAFGMERTSESEDIVETIDCFMHGYVKFLRRSSRSNGAILSCRKHIKLPQTLQCVNTNGILQELKYRGNRISL